MTIQKDSRKTRRGVRGFFGVNLSGPEFSPWNGQTWPTTADLTFLAAQRVNLVRLPIAWESLQPTLGGNLDTTYLNNLKNTINIAHTLGMGVIVDLHNFGYYADQSVWTTTVGYAGNRHTLASGVNVIGDGTLTTAHLVDVWQKLTTAIKDVAGVVGYGIMNEPGSGIPAKNLLKIPNYFMPPGSFPWSTANGGSAVQLAVGSNPLGAGYGPAWQLNSGSSGGFGKVFQQIAVTAVPMAHSVYAKVASGTGNLRLHIGALASTHTVTTTWQRFTLTGTPTAGTQDIGVQCNMAAGNSIIVANAQLELGSSATTYEPNPWLGHAQAAVTAIRAIDADMPIYVAGFDFGNGDRWYRENYEMCLVTGGNIIFEAHQYFDGPQGVGGGGSYSGSYASYNITPNSGVEAFDKFNAWCTEVGVKGFYGEFGVPSSDADWRALQKNFLRALRHNRMRGTCWFYGANGIKPAEILNLTIGGNRLYDVVSS